MTESSTPIVPEERVATPYATLDEQLRVQREIAADANNLLLTYVERRGALVARAEDIARRIEQLDADFVSAPERIAYAAARADQIAALIKQRGTPIIKTARDLERMLSKRNELLSKLRALNVELDLSPTDLEEVEVGDVADEAQSDAETLHEHDVSLEDLPAEDVD